MRLAVTTAVWLAALVLAGGATAAGIGANDDTGKFAADGGTLFFSQMAALGLKQSVMTVRFLPSDPTSIPRRRRARQGDPGRAARRPPRDARRLPVSAAPDRGRDGAAGVPSPRG